VFCLLSLASGSAVRRRIRSLRSRRFLDSHGTSFFADFGGTCTTSPVHTLTSAVRKILLGFRPKRRRAFLGVSRFSLAVRGGILHAGEVH